MSAAPVIMGGSCVDCSFLDEHSPSHTFVSQWGGGVLGAQWFKRVVKSLV